ncbi:MAG: hypothetical protein IJB44_06815, partial [Clostridia bacterium]|nr:hypothetical protein [Clostridia bacterium]
TDDTLNLANPAHLNFSGEITISAWIMIDTTGGFRTIVGHGNDGTAEVFLRLSGDRYQFGSWIRSTADHMVSAPISDEDIGTWVQLTGTYDGTSWNLYKNGELTAL